MKLNLIVNPVMGGWAPSSTRLGGTEESVVEWATRLKKRGHDVEVFHNGDHGRWGDVPYRERIDYPTRVNSGGGLTLNCNYPDLAPLERTVYFNNLVHAGRLDLGQFLAVIHPSAWARDNLGVTHPHQEIVPHGFDRASIYPETKIPGTVLYASSPDRGLRELEEAWPQVVDECPHANLIVTYNGHLSVPNFLALGDVSSDDMSELFRTCDVWVHPCLGGELFGITGVKAQAAGCWPVYYPTMALAETVQYGTRTDRRHLAEDLISAIRSHPVVPKVRLVDWDESTDILEATLLKYA